MLKKILKVFKLPFRLAGYVSEFAKLRKLLGMGGFELSGFLLRIISSAGFRGRMNKLRRAAISSSRDGLIGGWIYFIYGAAIYATIRHKRPEVVVETGVGPGSTSAFILKALEDNGKGALYSIDLPGNDAVIYPQMGKAFNVHVPPGYAVGWLVPPELRHRWKLILGDSAKELPKLMTKLGRVDVFLHDSLHTAEHIFMEFGVVLPFMGGAGVLLCDDVTPEWSMAFTELCKAKNIPYFIFSGRLGVAKIP